MLEDRMLLWKLKRGNINALGQIYRKHKDTLLALALSLSHDRAIAEDAVHDVFVSFAEYVDRLQLRGNLKSYLASSVANRIRRLSSNEHNELVSLSNMDVRGPHIARPDKQMISGEQEENIRQALGRLPYPQREVIILHLQEGMRFHTIAELQGTSINTVQSRYSYGLDKLRTLLEGRVE